MANDIFNGSVYLDDPNVRFGVTFLSNKYRNNAVRGEVMMDKATGELFLRRATDGKVVSFQQHHVDVNDLLFDLRVVLASNSSYSTPTSLAFPDSCYVSMDFDLMRLTDNVEKDIIGTDLDALNGDITTNNDSSTHMIYFKIASNTNGFGIKLMPRDTDRGLIAWATSTYNSICKFYNGTDPVFLAEKDKFFDEDLPSYEESDAVMYYDVVIDKEDGTTDVYEMHSCIVMAANNPVVFPESFPVGDIKNSKNTFIRIKSIEFDKLHFMMEHYKTLPNHNDYIEMYEKIKPADSHVYIRYCTANYFIDNVKDVVMTGNNIIAAVISTSTIDVYLARMNSITSDIPILFTPTRPSDGLWAQNAIWFEHARDVSQGSEEVIYGTETSFKQLEDYLAGNPDDSFLSIDEIKEEYKVYLG